MSLDTPEIAAARIEAGRARERMMDTARELQERLSPATLAQSAWAGAKEKGADLAEEAVDAVRSRPAIASGVVAALALFFAREPLIDMAGKLAKGVQAKRQASKDKPKSPRPKSPRPKSARPAPRKPRPPKSRPRKPATKPKATETIE
jgi:hypothetical protein